MEVISTDPGRLAAWDLALSNPAPARRGVQISPLRPAFARRAERQHSFSTPELPRSANRSQSRRQASLASPCDARVCYPSVFERGTDDPFGALQQRTVSTQMWLFRRAEIRCDCVVDAFVKGDRIVLAFDCPLSHSCNPSQFPRLV